MSRYSLIPATGLSSGSVSKVVTELITDGLVEEAGSIDSRRGRPRILVRIAPGGGHLIGVDVGETRVLVELFDLCLTELARAATLPLADFFAHGGRRPHPTDRPTPLPPWQASLSRRLAH